MVMIDYIVICVIIGINIVGWGIWNNFGVNINVYELDENGIVVYVDISGDDGLFIVSCEIM